MLLEDKFRKYIGSTFIEQYGFSEKVLSLIVMNTFNPKWLADHPFRYKIGYTFFQLCSIFPVIFGFWCAFYTFMGRVEDMLNSFVPAFYGIQMCAKTIIFVLNKEKFRTFKERIQNTKSESGYAPILGKYQRYTMIAIGLITIAFINGELMFIIFPIFDGVDWSYPLNFCIPGLP